MDGAILQAKVYRGYALSANVTGLPYQLFRATSAMDPMAGVPLLTLPAAFSVTNYKFVTAQGYGKPVWQCLIDGSQTQVWDILVGPQKTYFIAAMQALLPILAVEAPRTVDVRRPARETAVGAAPYSGTTPATETIIMQQWPASVLQGKRGEKTDADLPDDLKAPMWDLLLPAWPGVILETSDVIQDDLGRRFIVASPEITPLGWRVTALQEQA